ncbi:hypothetical protein SAMN05444274_103224 [Mariniphaga anaerophila]|uniref:Glycosyl hydrolase family 99 n=1 Tax=Mariniphaga anaerophila TaxID=1484053 RepID=A0A1M4Y529_9BACT|nr:glycoside hydrolase family 71/99-like protein [Mariniphaga anaerophila]SHF00552.1 hypothetical protein SAMN05444274_103224 [Mariniphaga anaerophila]
MKNRAFSIGVVFGILMFSSVCSFGRTPDGNGKKVYADYHGVRYTRQHDGKLGRWEMYANTEKSATERKTLCYNADNILENGRHDIAATAYPLVGMQSNLDPDYIEYQILSAKAAKIDGFFIEWGYMHHENDILLREMQKVAARYNFEIGVNWCDGWLYYNWITKLYPEINTREKKTEHYVRCYQYLIDSVFSVPTAPLVNGRPVFYLFGPGATPEEYKWVTSKIHFPENIKQPAVLRRWADWGRLENDKYIPVTKSEDIDKWVKLGTIPTAWIPARVRTMDENFPHWDNYALADDLIEFMKPFRDSIWNSARPSFSLKSGFAMPGMDNRGCAGWGRGHFFCIPRNQGKTYEQMWNFCLANKDSLDMMFIASWSDYTEGHEIEPTVENGDRELRNTLKYAAQFKNEQADDRGIALPLQLFTLRKQTTFLKAFFLNVSTMEIALDYAARLISNGEYKRAKKALDKASEKLNKAGRLLSATTIVLSEEKLLLEGTSTPEGYNIFGGLKVSFPDELVKKLTSNNYKGYISFEYLDNGFDLMEVRSKTARKPVEQFEIVGRIKTDNTQGWKKAKIALFKDNILYAANPAFTFKGKGVVRNVSVVYEIFQTELK